MDVVIDKEFAALCPPLTMEELGTLENSLAADGCRDALSVWRENGSPLLLDGHNRFNYCTRNAVKYTTREMKFASRDEARNWIIANQLGRRNLTEDQKSYLRGKRYNAEKLPMGGDRVSQKAIYTNYKQEPHTHKRLADEYGVSPASIVNDAKFASAVDALAKSSGEKTRSAILGGTLKITKQDVVKLAELSAEKQKAAVSGGPDAIKDAVKPHQKKNRKTIADGKVSLLGIKAAEASLKQLVEVLERIGLTGSVSRHVDAIRKEIENVRNSNS